MKNLYDYYVLLMNNPGFGLFIVLSCGCLHRPGLDAVCVLGPAFSFALGRRGPSLFYRPLRLTTDPPLAIMDIYPYG